MRIKPRTVVAATVVGAAVLLLSGALDKFFLHATGTTVRREAPRGRS
ncbi:hypothetical protein [Micromonospora endophytica]|nr:hypothetical protein [Micromonospora endophytica]